MNRQLDLRPRAVGRRLGRRPGVPSRMVVCLRPQSDQATTAEPVFGERLLIGGDPQCDVCLSGQDIPDLHTILSVDGAAAWAEVVVAEPPLIVNGVETEHCRLHDGDVLQIGPARFEVRFSAALMPSAAVRKTAAELRSVPACDGTPGELEAFTASELVDLIEAEEIQVASFEACRRRGLKALARAVESRRDADRTLRPINTDDGPDGAEPQSALDPETDLAERIDLISEQFERLADRLAARSDDLADREQRFTEAVASLAALQRQLDQRLSEFRARSADNDEHSRRKAA